MNEVDKRQEGGTHYKNHKNPSQEHWNLARDLNWDYFTAQIIKYMMRWRSKGGVGDLKKAAHFLEKLIDLETAHAQLSPLTKHQGAEWGRVEDAPKDIVNDRWGGAEDVPKANVNDR